jgi:hypothetical protein
VANEDASNVVSAQVENVGKMGGNATLAQKFFDSYGKFITDLIVYQNNTQEATTINLIVEILDFTDDCISSFSGMNGFKNNPVLRSDPENARFYQLYEQFQQVPYVFNKTTLNNIIEITKLTGRTSVQSQICKYYQN